MSYVDNCLRISTLRRRAAEGEEAMARVLRSKGLPVHEETDPDDAFTFLGWPFDGVPGWFSGKGDRRWDLHESFPGLLAGAPLRAV